MSQISKRHTPFYRAFLGLSFLLFFSLIGSENLCAQAITSQISGGGTTISPGQVVCYDVAFAAPDKGANHNYTNITIVNVLDPRFEYISSTGSNNFNNGSFSGGTVTWTAATLDDGVTGSFQICVRLKNGAATNGDNIPNQLTFNESGTTTATSGTPTITVTGVLPNAITFEKVLFSGGGNVVLDEPVTYDIKVCNTGGVTNTNFSVTDYLPAGAQILFTDGGTISGNNITWTEGPDATYNNRTYIEPGVCWEFSPIIVFPSPTFSTNDPTSNFKNDVDGTGTPGTGSPITYPQVSTQPGAIVSPNYVMKTNKYGNSNTSVGYQGAFNFEFSNEGNASIKNLTIIDPVPPQINITEIAGLRRGSVPRANFSYKINGLPTIYTYAPLSTIDRGTFIPVSAFLTNPADYISEIIFTFTVDIFAGTSQNDYLSPTVNYVTLVNTHPYTISGGTIVAAASVPVVTPSNFTNTAKYTSSSPLTIPDASLTVLVKDKAPIPAVDKLLSKVLETYGNGRRAFSSSTAENVSPSDTVEYVLRVANDDKATDYLKNFTLTDVLPAGVTYVPNSWFVIGASQVSTTNGTYNGIVPTQAVQIPATEYNCSNSLMTYYESYGTGGGCNLISFGGKALIMPQPTFTQSGQNLAWTWDWDAWYNNYSGPNPAVALYGGAGYQTSIFIKFKAVVKPTVTTNSTINNNFTITSPQISAPITSNNTVQTVLRKASLSSKKTVQGSLDGAFTLAGHTIPGGTADYCLRVYNDGNVPMKNIRVIDVLPYVNDIKILNDVPRVNPGASDWRPILDAALLPPTGVTVMYSTAQKPCLAGITSANANPMINLAACNNPNFTSTPPSDLSTVQTLAFDFGSMVLNPGDSVKLCWKMKAPVDALVNQLAWNSFAYVADYADGSGGGLLPSEPPPVSLIIQCPKMTGHSADTTVCSGSKPVNMYVDTDMSDNAGINFVYFSSPQSGTAMYTGGTSLGTVTGNGARATLGIAASFPTNTTASLITYYVYTIINPTPANVGCRVSQEIKVTVSPQIAAIAAANTATCTGATANSDGSITVSNFGATDKYAFVSGSSYSGSATYAAGSTTIPAGGVIVNNLANPAANQDYTVRVFQNGGCFKDITVTLAPKTCAIVCTPPSAPALSVTNNVCPSTTGTINVTTACGAGTRIEYSTDNGSTWSATAPTYGSSPITVVVRCVTDADATCFSPNSAAVTTAPVTCPPPPPAAPCSITITQQTQSVCNNNGTNRRAQDDYFTVSINATAISGGAQYEVVNLANTDGTGGNPLGFAAYGTAVTVGSSGNLIANNTAFTLTVRDLKNNACFKTITLNPVPPCSSNATEPPNGPCGAVPCAPIKAVKNGQN